jgi:hypothetical protein
MAEAYLNSKHLPEVVASSSGVNAEVNHNESICWYSLQILQEAELLQYTAPTWTKTTLEILQENNCIIFMQEEHYNFVQKHFQYNPPRFEIWDIPDIPSAGFFETKKAKAKKLEADKHIFEMIKKKVDMFIESLD